MSAKLDLPQIEIVEINLVIKNPDNPRIIKDAKFKKLVKSVTDFPQMLNLRPVIVNEAMMALGGNMRLAAALSAGHTHIPIIRAENLTPEQQKEFIIKDNVGFGEWDFELLANEWETELLVDWGVDLWNKPEELDYNALNSGSDLDSDMDNMAAGVRKAIQIEFEPADYPVAQELVKFWREQDAYVGAMLIEYLKAEKEKLN